MILRNYKTDVNPYTDDKKIRWIYESRDTITFWFYLPEHSEEIESAYQKYLKKELKEDLYLTIEGKQYKIDFSKMMQISPTGITRNIKRTDEKDRDMVKGVGGVMPK
jgi:hypothetical protein